MSMQIVTKSNSFWKRIYFVLIYLDIYLFIIRLDFCTHWKYLVNNWTLGGALGWSVRLASGRLGVRIPSATDLIRQNILWQVHCQTLSNKCVCHGSLEMIIINEWPWVPSTDQNLQPFIGNGDVSIWVKNSGVGHIKIQLVLSVF